MNRQHFTKTDKNALIIDFHNFFDSLGGWHTNIKATLSCRVNVEYIKNHLHRSNYCSRKTKFDDIVKVFIENRKMFTFNLDIICILGDKVNRYKIYLEL